MGAPAAARTVGLMQAGRCALISPRKASDCEKPVAAPRKSAPTGTSANYGTHGGSSAANEDCPRGPLPAKGVRLTGASRGEVRRLPRTLAAISSVTLPRERSRRPQISIGLLALMK